MNTPDLEAVLRHLGEALGKAIADKQAAGAVISVINGQLGPYLGAQAKAIEELQAEVKKLKPTSP